MTRPDDAATARLAGPGSAGPAGLRLTGDGATARPAGPGKAGGATACGRRRRGATGRAGQGGRGYGLRATPAMSSLRIDGPGSGSPGSGRQSPAAVRPGGSSGQSPKNARNSSRSRIIIGEVVWL
jgi:hypothetical protein